MCNDVTKENKLKIALAVVSILLIVSLIANLYFYSRQYGVTPDSGLESQVADIQNQVNSLTSDKYNLQSQVSSLTSETESLQNERDILKSAKLVTKIMCMYVGTEYLTVTGSVWNVGNIQANNCKLRVILYQGQDPVYYDYINLGIINGESGTNVNEKVYFAGLISNWIITPEWE